MTGQEVVRLLLTSGGAVVVVAVLNAFVTRRKVSADVLGQIEQSAGRWVERQERRIQALEDQVAEMRRYEAEHRVVLRLHEVFDRAVIEELRARGVADAPDPPPLFPPHR